MKKYIAVMIFMLLLASPIYGAMTNSASKILTNKSYITSGDSAMNPLYKFCNEAETIIEAMTLEDGNTLTFGNGLTIDNATDNKLEINENSDELILTFGSNTVTMSSGDVNTFSFGTIVVDLDKFKSNATTFTLPTTDGTTGQVMQTNGSGTLSWAANGGTASTGTTNTTYEVDSDTTHTSLILSAATTGTTGKSTTIKAASAADDYTVTLPDPGGDTSYIAYTDQSDGSVVTTASTGTTNDTFTLASGESDGTFILSVGATGTDNSVTLIAPVTTQDVVLTLPDAASDTLVGIGATQTLAAKTLTAPTINAATLTGNLTITTPTVLGTWANLGNVTTVNIDGGTVDGAVIGAASAAAITGTTITGTTITDGTISVASGAVTGALDISGATVTYDWDGTSFTGAIAKDTDLVMIDDNGTKKEATYQVLMDGVNDLAAYTGTFVPGTDTVLVDDGGVAKSSTYQIFMDGMEDLTAAGAGAVVADKLAYLDGGVAENITVQNLFNVSDLTAYSGTVAPTSDELIFQDAGVAKSCTYQVFMDGMEDLTAAGAGASYEDKLVYLDGGVAENITVQNLFNISDLTAFSGEVDEANDEIIYQDAGTAKSCSYQTFMDGVNDLAALGAAPATTDTVLLDDAGTAKKVTVQNLLNGVNSLDAAGTGAIVADGVFYNDGGVAKKITIQNLFNVSDLTATAGPIAPADDELILQDDGVAESCTYQEFMDGVNDLTALGAAPAVTDSVLIDDAGTAKKITVQYLLDAVDSLTAAGAGAVVADSLLYDDGGIAEKITIQNLFNVSDLTAFSGAVAPASDEIILQDAGTGKSCTYQVFMDGVADLTAASIATGDKLLFMDSGSSDVAVIETIDDISTFQAGTASSTGLSATSGVLSVDAGSLTSFTGAIVPGTDEVLISDGGTDKAATYQVLMDGIADLTAASIASGDKLVFADSGSSDVAVIETIDDVATLLAGEGLTATSAVIAVTKPEKITFMVPGTFLLAGDYYTGGLAGLDETLDITATEAAAAYCKSYNHDNTKYANLSVTGAQGEWTSNYQLLPDAEAENDAVYFGADVPFCELYYDMSATVATYNGAAASQIWEYSQGSSTWATLTLKSDSTDVGGAGTGQQPFGSDGCVTFVPPADWATDTVDSQADTYWIRCRCTAAVDITQIPITNDVEHKVVTPADGAVVPFKCNVYAIRATDGITGQMHTTNDVKMVFMNFTKGTYSLELTWPQNKRTDRWTTTALKAASAGVDCDAGDVVGFLCTQADGAQEITNAVIELDVTPLP